MLGNQQLFNNTVTHRASPYVFGKINDTMYIQQYMNYLQIYYFQTVDLVQKIIKAFIMVSPGYSNKIYCSRKRQIHIVNVGKTILKISTRE